MTSAIPEKTIGSVWLATSIIAQTAATACFKLTGQSSPSGHAFTALTTLWYWFALIALGIQTLCWLQALRVFDLSVAHPISSLAIGTNLACAIWLFDEKVTIGHLLGIALIIAGATLTSQTSP